MTGQGTADERWLRPFLDALRRYRRVTVVGWAVAFSGVAGLILRWESPGLIGLLDIGISAATVAAGVVLVHYGIEGLSAFIRTALDAMPDGGELREIMEEVDRGGWQEAFAAHWRIGRMVDGDNTYN